MCGGRGTSVYARWGTTEEHCEYSFTSVEVLATISCEGGILSAWVNWASETIGRDAHSKAEGVNLIGLPKDCGTITVTLTVV